MTTRGAAESGAAALLVVTLAVLVLALTILAGGLGRLLVDQRRASSAADLAALAGAGALQRGSDACAAAATTAHRNDAELVSCTVAGDQVRVRSAIRLTGMAGLLRLLDGVSVEAEALAGPVGTGASAATDERVEQKQRAGLVERVVPVAALR